MKLKLTIEDLKQEAKRFCEIISKENHIDLIGVTDGKAVGTYAVYTSDYQMCRKAPTFMRGDIRHSTFH